MSECLVIGIDDSECSLRSLDFAVTRAKRSGARIILSFIIEWSPYSFNTPEENEVRHKRREEEIEKANSSVLDPALKRLAETGLSATAIVRHGNVADVLSEVAKENDADQIIVGRIGESGLKSMLFGSVTSKLVQTSTIPVTVVP
jgi:nucleotide-binding universal stress UspA family protein